MSRFHQSRAAAHRSRALALTVAAMLACACGDDDDGATDEGDAARPDGSTQRSDGGDAGGRDGSVDGGRDAAVDAAIDAGPTDPSMPGEDPPTLTEVGYFRPVAGSTAPVIVIAGRDPNGDIDKFSIKLFKGPNTASVDINGDQVSSESEYTGDVPHDPAHATFRHWFTPSLEFLEKVDRIEVTVRDKGNRPSEAKSATLMAGRTASGVCEPGGYPQCGPNFACLANTSGKFMCTPVSTARTQACQAPLELHPPQVTSVTGSLNTGSLWDAPASCSPNDPKNYPDRLVRLKLDSAATVVVSSSNVGTNFDSVLYKLDSCQIAPAMCTASPCGFCEDDVMTSGTMTDRRAVLTLTNLPAGDHLLVIDSRGQPDDMGNNFEITATIQ